MDAKRDIALALLGQSKPPENSIYQSLSGLANYLSPSNQDWAPWPVRAVRSGLAALAAPGDAYSGRLPMMDASGRTNPEAIGRMTDLAGLMMSGTSFGAPAGLADEVLFGSGPSLRDRYALALREATGGKDPRRIKLTPDRIEGAKEAMRTGYGLYPEGRPNPPLGSQPSPYRATTQAQQAADFAAQARGVTNDVRVKFPEGPNGSVYVRVGDRGTVRFSDHPAPREYVLNPATGVSEKQVVGGFSPSLGRRHQPAQLSVAPGNAGMPDALRWLND